MRKLWPHVVGVITTALWFRYGLASAVLHGSGWIAGGSCFIGEISVVERQSLDNAYFAMGIPTISWKPAVVGAISVAVPALVLGAFVTRGRIGYWIGWVLGGISAGVGALPFLACRFSAPGSATSAFSAALILFFALGLSFLIYWIAFGVTDKLQNRAPQSETTN